MELASGAGKRYLTRCGCDGYSNFDRFFIMSRSKAPPLGILFFAPYLLYLIVKSNSDPRQLLLEVHA